MTTLGEAVERTARALGVAGRHTLTLYEVPRDGWQVFDGRTPLMPATGHGSVTTTTEAVAGAARFMDASARAEVTVDGVLLFNALRPHVDAPTGAVVLTCVKPPVLALPKDDLTAALVLLCHTLPETRERCPACKSKGIEHVAGETPPPGYRCPNGWAWNVVQGRWERPCARCSATGWVPRSWGAVLLGAMPRDKTGLTDAVRSTCSQRYLGAASEATTTTARRWPCSPTTASGRATRSASGWPCFSGMRHAENVTVMANAGLVVTIADVRPATAPA